MDRFDFLCDGGFEGLHFLSDRKTGLRALVGIHSTRLGPALGGTRALATYTTEDAAITDVLRLARGMTYKAAVANLPLGGGKAVIMLPPSRFDRGQLFEAFGRAVDSLRGRYITTEDSGTSPDDMDFVLRHTRHVVGLKSRSGDPSPVTAYGVVRGIEAIARNVLKASDLKGLRVTLLGVGHVGYALAGELRRRGAKLFVSDINPSNLARAVTDFGATAVGDNELIMMEADIFAPCALGAGLNDRTIPQLKVKAVAGAANNQLEAPRHGALLADRGIFYAPDYAINGGGLISVAQEVVGYDTNEAMSRAGKIYDTLEHIIMRSKESGLRPEQVADQLAEERLAR